MARARYCGSLELFLKVRISTVNVKMKDLERVLAERLTGAFTTRGRGTGRVQNIDRSTDEGGCCAKTAQPATRPRPPSLASPPLSAYPLLVTLLTNLLVNPCSSPPSSPSPDYTSASPSFMENDSQSLNQALSSSFVHATQGGTHHVSALQTKSINRS